MKAGTIPNATFNPAHVAAADLSTVGKFLLRKILLFAECSDACSEFLEGRVLGGLTSLARHDPNAAESRPFGPRPMGYNVEIAVVAMRTVSQTAPTSPHGNHLARS